MSIVIDLLCLRPKQVGGTEYFIRNLLDGIKKIPDIYDITLMVSKDNADTFQHYAEDSRFHILIAPIESSNIAKRIIWQNMFQNRFLRKHGFQACFEPVYCKPWFNGGIRYTCVIHDLQAYHYPKYHPLHEIVYSRLCWKMDTRNAYKIIAISNWVKSDIVSKYGRENIDVIYNPILINKDEFIDFSELERKYQIQKNNFFYSIAQMIPHKNIETIIALMSKIISEKIDLPCKLLISGVNGSSKEKLIQMIEDNNLEDNIFLTGVVDNAERNTLYKYCRNFLFPSVFEGFGMPPVEAMLLGGNVVTTDRTSIPEVTQGKANYVHNPYDVDEWIEVIKKAENKNSEMDFSIFDSKKIAKQYLQAIMK